MSAKTPTPRIVSTPIEVERRLTDLGLVRESILAIGRTARVHADDASPNMPLNASGMLSYIYGVYELRQQLIGRGYFIDRACGIESVIRRDRSVRIGFQNVDKCCDLEEEPIPRSYKGSGAASLSDPRLFSGIGLEIGPLTAVKPDGVLTYYVMVGLDSSIELSCPVISKGTYVAWPERIFIHSPTLDWETEPEIDTSPIDDFDVNVSLKSE